MLAVVLFSYWAIFFHDGFDACARPACIFNLVQSDHIALYVYAWPGVWCNENMAYRTEVGCLLNHRRPGGGWKDRQSSAMPAADFLA